MSKKILCFGDSNTYGYDPRTTKRYLKNIRWTGILQEELGSNFEIIEEGCNGRTTVFPEPGAEWKAGHASIQVVLNTHKPVDLVILMLGSNDLKNYYYAETATIAAGAERLVQMIQAFTREKQEKEAKILLVSPPVIGDGIEESSPFSIKKGSNFDASAIVRSKQFHYYYKNIAERYGCLFVDAAAHITSSEVDSLHLDPEAHETLAHVFAKVLKDYYPEEMLPVTKQLTIPSADPATMPLTDSPADLAAMPLTEPPADLAEETASTSAITGLSMSRLRHIIARLRGPETGCRWDKAQTLESVKPCCVEEVAEVLAGIDMYNATGNAENLKEELGDLLMQVVLQSQMAEELGLFDLDDVIDGISKKMIRRHPHVFHTDDPKNGNLEEMVRENQARDENGNLLTTWAEIKALEKRGKVSADEYLPKAFDQVCEFVRAAEERKFGSGE